MYKQKTIYIFGNPLLEEDSLPLELKPFLEQALPQIFFEYLDPNENIKPQNKEMIIIDTVEGINRVMVFDEFKQLEDLPKYSAHDLDLGFNLLLLHKIGKLDKILIFGLPMEGEREKIAESLVRQIRSKMIIKKTFNF